MLREGWHGQREHGGKKGKSAELGHEFSSQE
jgi:hypothetical protein